MDYHNSNSYNKVSKREDDLQNKKRKMNIVGERDGNWRACREGSHERSD
ncbi:hypothetical protein MtrunA17_Chr6g0464901 [Medicago truncatula]|uniref:Uncharacterized protein n=1 Tax=Medicago truncatula TaxID=3880 RepID=A0A396HH16_MEDTR|nr:hypothetical protein MtrunA17_Chr6g0464901 [Medicago truncatula]